MKTVLFMFAVLFAFATVSAGLNFSDSTIWKVKTTSDDYSVFVEKRNTKVYINDMINDEFDVMFGVFLCPGRSPTSLAFDKAGNTWIATDSGLYRQSASDTTVYYMHDGPAGQWHEWVADVYYDADSNRIIIGTSGGVCLTNLDASNQPTVWVVKALSVPIKQVIVVKGEVWALSAEKVYRCLSGNWVEYTQFLAPGFGDVDRNGNFWLSFYRHTGDSADCGLAKFDGQNWTEHLVTRDDWTKRTGDFGTIRIDKDNTLWFSCMDAGLGKVDLSAMTVDRIPAGTYSWAPADGNHFSVALSITDKGAVIFSGHYAWIENIATGSAVRNPFVARNFPRGDYKVIGTFDPQGRKIVNSLSAHSVSGLRFFVVQTPQGLMAKKVLIKK